MKGMLLPVGKYVDNIITGATSVELNDLSDKQLDLIKLIVKNEGVGSINLKTDKKIIDKYSGDFKEGTDHLTTTYGQLRNTFGGFNVTKNDKDEYIITDTYDWTNDYKDMGYKGDTLNMLGKIAYEHGGTKEGKGTPYKINIGKLPQKGMMQPSNP